MNDFAGSLVKTQTPVTVVIGNPPYDERAQGKGGWVENGGEGAAAPLDRFRQEGNGRVEYVLKSFYVYFYAWAAWKVFEANAAHRHGIVTYITTAGYLTGPGFKGMRHYLRTTCSEGWIINVSPEGMQPDVPTRLFPAVQQPLAIAIFVRRADTDPSIPAGLHYTTIAKETGACPPPHRIAYRSFDRQWIIPDQRVIDRPRAELWAAEKTDDQLFIVEQHTEPINSGPGIVFTTLIPDMHYFKGSEGGRVLPVLHPDGSANVAPQLLARLGQRLGITVAAPELAAYIAAVTAHPAYTARFAEELVTPGIRVPLTADRDVFEEAVTLGRELIWAATYGAAFADPSQGRLLNSIAYPATDARRVRNLTPIGAMLPERITYDGVGQTIYLGNGSFGPVTERVWTYDVGGMKIIKHWFDSRKANPGGRKSSPLDDIHVKEWPIEWVREFNELLTALRRISDLEADQADLLERIIVGPTVNRADLIAEGVRFPVSARDRRPRYGANDIKDAENTLQF